MEHRPFRIAIRGEGEWVNGYFTNIKDMKDAILIFKISKSAMDAGGPQAFDTLQQLAVDISIGLLKGVLTEKELTTLRIELKER